MPGEASTLPALLVERERTIPDELFGHVSEQGREIPITYGELARRSRAVARALARRGVRAGDTVPIALPTSADYLFTLFGAQMLGAAVAPVAPLVVFQKERIRFHTDRLLAVAACCEAATAVVAADAAPHLTEAAGQAGVEFVVVDSLLVDAPEGDFETPEPDADRLAVVQFSSGSTAEPKGVCIRYRHIFANAEAVRRHGRVEAGDQMLSFLPLYHDFGLVAGLFYPLVWGIPTWLYSTQEFVQRPSFWMKAMSRTGATIGSAPQFVYQIGVQRVRDRDLQGVDLSRWRFCFNGAEPIHAPTLRAFQERFAPYGMGPNVISPGYGLAESTLTTTLQVIGDPMETERVARDDLVDRGVARLAGEGEPAVEVVSCGAAIEGIDLCILDEGGRQLPERRVGEIVLRGTSVADEYILGPGVRSPLADDDGWFRTGDLGYLVEGKLRVTGRIKDVIIRGGRNYYPQDVERAVESLEGVRINGTVAFGHYDEERAEERIVVVVERGTNDRGVLDSLPERVRRAVYEALDVTVDDVVVLGRRERVPKTTSGKLQRSRARQLYLAGAFEKEETGI